MVYFIIWYLIGIVSSVYFCKTEQGSIKVRDIIPFALSGFVLFIILFINKKKDDIQDFFDKDIY
jgi:hypothetical protein